MFVRVRRPVDTDNFVLGYVKCERVFFKKDLIPAMKRMLAAKEPYVMEVVPPYPEHVLPLIPAGHTVADMIY